MLSDNKFTTTELYSWTLFLFCSSSFALLISTLLEASAGGE